MLALNTYLRRSKFKLENAIISKNACFDGPKMLRLTETCKLLENLKLHKLDLIQGPVADALFTAKHLTKITCTPNTIISPRTMMGILNACQKTLVEARFLGIVGRGNGNEQWPRLESMEFFELKHRKSYGEFIRLVSFKLTPMSGTPNYFLSINMMLIFPCQ